jgi:hypothetical protein
MASGFIFIWEEKLEFDVAASDADVPGAEAGEVWHQRCSCASSVTRSYHLIQPRITSKKFSKNKGWPKSLLGAPLKAQMGTSS